MCEFCEKIKNEEYVNLANSINDLGILGDMQVGIMVWNNLDGTFTMNTSTTGPFDRVEEAEININYCPMCGRDLRSGIDDKN